jgi:hypothetical protein
VIVGLAIILNSRWPRSAKRIDRQQSADDTTFCRYHRAGSRQVQQLSDRPELTRGGAKRGVRLLHFGDVAPSSTHVPAHTFRGNGNRRPLPTSHAEARPGPDLLECPLRFGKLTMRSGRDSATDEKGSFEIARGRSVLFARQDKPRGDAIWVELQASQNTPRGEGDMR